MVDILNALALLANFVIVPALAYGSQLALGALGVTMVYAVLRFSNFAHGEIMSFGAMISVLGTWGLQEPASPLASYLPRCWHCRSVLLRRWVFACFRIDWFIAITGAKKQRR